MQYALDFNILKHSDLFTLRQYISRKFPDTDTKERAAILANAVHRVLDGNLQEFGDKDRVRIRKALLQKAISENNFTISAGDILATALAALGECEECAGTVTRWLNRVQDIPVSREKALILIKEVQQQSSLSESAPELSPSLQAVDKYAGTIPGVATKREIQEINRTVFSNIDHSLESRDTVHQSLSRQSINKRKMPVIWVASLTLAVALMFQPARNFIFSLPGALSPSQASTRELKKNAMENELPVELKYKNTDTAKLKNYLNEKNSILAEDPYFITIIRTAEEYDINPLLLFAITGQEQGFVPKDHKNALKIANNPFNIYHSWQEYNTDIEDSARIAAVTVVNLSKGRPQAVDPIAWINVKYAEDKNWWIGVNRIFKDLVEVVE